jgi:hypothetical protein
MCRCVCVCVCVYYTHTMQGGGRVCVRTYIYVNTVEKQGAELHTYIHVYIQYNDDEEDMVQLET